MMLPHVKLDLNDVLRWVPHWEDRVINVKDRVRWSQMTAHTLIDDRRAFVERELRNVAYVGRRNSVYYLSGHALANPFKLNDFTRGRRPPTTEDRLTCLRAYWRWLDELNPHYLATCLFKLKGLRLACWCAPELCHAHVLAVLANQEDLL